VGVVFFNMGLMRLKRFCAYNTCYT
jgi:hypothetical protein